jgi:hypothetical protein
MSSIYKGLLTKGRKVLCIKTCDENGIRGKRNIYVEGNKYDCVDGDCIIDAYGEPRMWDAYPTQFNEHFRLLKQPIL